jgi:hypothetical protein
MTSDYFDVKCLGLTSEQTKAVGYLAEFTKRMVVFAFPEHKTPARASSLIKEVYRVTDDMMTGCLQNGTKLACKIGCNWCCRMRVKTTSLEVLHIADFLRSRLRPRELSEFRQRLAATDATTRGMDGSQRIQVKMVCPLLVDGKCSAYPVRPIACRVYHSLNASDCKLLLDDEEHSLRVRRDVSGLSMGIFAGLTEGLRAIGLQTRLLELIAGIRIVIDEPGLVKRWFAGEPAFVGAEISNANRVESVHRKLVEELWEPWDELRDGCNDS